MDALVLTSDEGRNGNDTFRGGAKKPLIRKFPNEETPFE